MAPQTEEESGADLVISLCGFTDSALRDIEKFAMRMGARIRGSQTTYLG
jgi:hypothetical protein